MRGFVVPERGGYSRSDVDGIVGSGEGSMGGTGLVWARRAEDGTITARSEGASGEEAVRRLLDAGRRRRGGLLLVAAGEPDATSKLLGQLRLHARQEGRTCSTPRQFAFLWVVDFPLFEWDADEKRYVSMHHPFTSPLDDDVAKLDAEPGRGPREGLRPRAQRQRDRRRQHPNPRRRHCSSRIFSLLNISDEEAKLAVRLLPRGARVRHAAARRHRARPRPHGGASSAARARFAR